MFALSLLTDDLLYICTLQEVCVRSKKYFVRYTDTKKYSARVLAISNNRKFLRKLKSNIESGAREKIEGSLTLVCDRRIDYLQVSKAITKCTDDDSVFVDTAICPDVNVGSCIRTLLLDWANEQEDFFDNAPEFWEFKIRNASKQNANTFSTLMNHQSQRRKAPASSPLIRQNIISAPGGLSLKTSLIPNNDKNGDKAGVRDLGDERRKSSSFSVRAITTPVPEFTDFGTSRKVDETLAISEPEEMTPKTQSATIIAPNASSTPGVVTAKCQIIEERGVSAGVIRNDTHAKNNEGVQVTSSRMNFPVVKEERNDNKTNEMQPSQIANDNNSLSQEESIIITPSGTPDVSINEKQRKKSHPMYTYDDERELFAKGNSSKMIPSSSSSVLGVIVNTHHFGVTVETKKESIDPFINNVYLNEESINRCTLHTVDSAVNNGWEESHEEASGQKIMEKKSRNHSRYQMVDEKVKSTGFVHQSPFVTGDPTEIIDALVGDDQLGKPSFSFSTSESDLISNSDQVYDETSPVGDERNGQDWDEGEEDNSNENSDPGSQQDGVMAGVKEESSSVLRSLDITTGQHAFLSAPDDKELEVDKASSGPKKHFCFYCKKLQSKLARHLESVHRKEDDVKKFMALPPRNRERQAIIAKIRKNGDYIYNTDRQYNEGKLIVCRRPNTRKCTTAEDFLCCGNCKGQYVRSDLRQHSQKCTGRTGKKERVVVANGKRMASRVHARASAEVRTNVYPHMREDEVVRSIRYDELITVFANEQCQSTATPPYRTIRENLRLLGRFFIAVRKLDKTNCIVDFADVYSPCYYQISIAAVQIVARHNPEQNTFKSPAVAFRLGQLLRKVGEVQQYECKKRGMVVEEKKIEEFLKLLTRDVDTRINRVAAGPLIRDYSQKGAVDYEDGPSTSREVPNGEFDYSFIDPDSEL